MKHCILITFLCVLSGGLSVSAAESSSPGLLRLVGGDYIPGYLANSKPQEQRDGITRQLAWQHPEFATPIQFNLQSVVVASFPPPVQATPAMGQFAIELVGGDRVFGSILDIDGEAVHVGTEEFGELVIERSAVRRILRWNDGAAVLFAGPGDVLDWKVRPDAQAWHSGGNQLHTDKPGATAFRDIGLPETLRIEFELAWEGEPNFEFAVGVDAKNTEYGGNSAFHIEVWDDQITLMRELDQIADCVPLGNWKDLNGSLRLTLELDQAEGRMVALSPQAKVLGEITVNGDNYPGVRPGIRLTNIAGNVSLESLRVLRLTGQTSRETATNEDLIVLTDQTAQRGRWTDVIDNEWVLAEGESEQLIDPSKVLSIDLHSPPAGSSDQVSESQASRPENKPNATDASSPTVQVVTHGGVRLSGELQASRDGKLTLTSDLILEPIELRHADISRVSVASSGKIASESSKFILGRLEFPDARLTGRFIDTADQNQPTPLRFSPRHASAVNLMPTFSGRMVYRESPPPETAKQRRLREQREAAMKRANQRQANQGGVWNALARAFGNTASNKPLNSSPRSMHLRSGEIIPCEVTAIDERGVAFTSEVTERTRLPLDQIRAIAFTAGCRDPEIEAARRDRLLTVPRMRKKNPPTHLIVANNGDILRGRLVRVTDTNIEVATRLETIPIKRSVVAQIIWLDDHSDDEQGDDAESTGKESDELAVRAILRNGNRMSLLARSLESSVLIGEHPLLGESQIKLGDVNELLIGIDINQAERDQPYGDWLLKDAPESIIESAEGEGGAAAMSPLVGTAAPDFSLDLLGGGTFSISGSRGQVIVLDFWATWCGPCMQAMPVIEQAVAEFDEDDVRLVAVNLQETAEPILETLARLDISPEVALDIDGVAAARYQANAIPQTVVIDRAGKITHLFVGGGAKLGEQLHAAIAKTLEDEESQPNGQ